MLLQEYLEQILKNMHCWFSSVLLSAVHLLLTIISSPKVILILYLDNTPGILDSWPRSARIWPWSGTSTKKPFQSDPLLQIKHVLSVVNALLKSHSAIIILISFLNLYAQPLQSSVPSVTPNDSNIWLTF
jgi:hypothetical protein